MGEGQEDRIERLARRILASKGKGKGEIEGISSEAGLLALELRDHEGRAPSGPGPGSIDKRELASAMEELDLEGARIGRSEALGGSEGIHRLDLILPDGSRRRAYLKMTDPRPAAFGSGLARAAGLRTPRIAPRGGRSFMLMEDVAELGGRMLPDALSSGAERRIWDLLSSGKGAVRFMRAWLAYHERCRLAMIGDRHIRNSAIFHDGEGFGFIPIDNDAVAHGIGVRPDGSIQSRLFHNQFAVNSAHLLRTICSRSRMAARSGLCQRPIGEEEALGSFLEACSTGPLLSDHEREGIRSRIEAFICSGENEGMPFGLGSFDASSAPRHMGMEMLSGRRALEGRARELLLDAGRALAGQEEAGRFLADQARMVGWTLSIRR